MYETEVFDVLRKAFTYVGYPALILAVFAVIAWRMKTLFTEHEYHKLMQWRLAVAGLLPVTVLTFVVVGELPGVVLWLPTADQWRLQLVMGALMAAGTLEASLHVSGLVVAPGFIDLHAHGQDNASNALQARDGVTTALDLELGAYPVGDLIANRAGKAIVNYGVSAGHMPARVSVSLGRTTLLTGARMGSSTSWSPEGWSCVMGSSFEGCIPASPS